MHDLYDEKSAAAELILREAGNIQTCERHEDVLISKSDDLEKAFRIASREFKAGKYRCFSSQKELTNTIQSAFNDICFGHCYECDKMFSE